jgi:hypothetical protein
MALTFPAILEHNNPNYAAVDSDFVRGGTRSAVNSLADLYALYPLKANQLKERATKVYVKQESKYYVLTDLSLAGSSDGWTEDSTGGGGSQYYLASNPSGFITGIDTSSFYPRSNPSGFLNTLPFPAPPSAGTWLLAAQDGSMFWIEAQSCS